VPPPSAETVAAAIEALRADALVWHEAATSLRVSGGATASLALTGAQLSYAAERTGLTAVYDELQHKLTHLCAEAAANFDAVGGALEQAAAGYEHDERAAVHRLLGAW
jgi:hypothetical protein